VRSSDPLIRPEHHAQEIVGVEDDATLHGILESRLSPQWGLSLVSAPGDVRALGRRRRQALTGSGSGASGGICT